MIKHDVFGNSKQLSHICSGTYQLLKILSNIVLICRGFSKGKHEVKRKATSEYNTPQDQSV